MAGKNSPVSFQKFPAICFQKAVKNFPAICFQKAFKNFPANCFQKFSSDLLSKSCQKFSSDLLSKSVQKFSSDLLSKIFQRFAFKTLKANRWKKICQLAFKLLKAILKGKRNAYFEFLNVGFILRTLFFLLSVIYTN